jgi:FlaA1/EpsC-like NDP-sugar epimerase
LSEGGDSFDPRQLVAHHAEALIGRPIRQLPMEGVRHIAGATVLVTGAGGSVGRALVAQLATLNAERIVVLDNHEASLFHLQRDIGKATPIEPRLTDLRNVAKVERILRETSPSIVFHLAARKHVPLGEQEPDEPVAVNVLATHDLLDAAERAGVRQFVYPSSDKAVNPPSVYGATKRLAEVLLLAHARRGGSMAVHIVRFVNVLGTSGSVVETFLEQARRGGPLTLTDARMTRYWMTMDEAVALLLHALAMPTGSHTMLDVGEPVPVEAMARRIYALARRDGGEPTLEITGTRAGERLAEELVSAQEHPEAEEQSSVLSITRPEGRAELGDPEASVAELRALVDGDDLDLLRRRVMELARRLQ